MKSLVSLSLTRPRSGPAGAAVLGGAEQVDPGAVGAAGPAGGLAVRRPVPLTGRGPAFLLGGAPAR